MARLMNKYLPSLYPATRPMTTTPDSQRVRYVQSLNATEKTTTNAVPPSKPPIRNLIPRLVEVFRTLWNRLVPHALQTAAVSSFTSPQYAQRFMGLLGVQFIL